LPDDHVPRDADARAVAEPRELRRRDDAVRAQALAEVRHHVRPVVSRVVA